MFVLDARVLLLGYKFDDFYATLSSLPERLSLAIELDRANQRLVEQPHFLTYCKVLTYNINSGDYWSGQAYSILGRDYEEAKGITHATEVFARYLHTSHVNSPSLHDCFTTRQPWVFTPALSLLLHKTSVPTSY